MGILFLVGARASGKTTIGKALARSLGLPFADTDQHLLQGAGLTVEQIVAAEGWPGFRKRESLALREVADAHPAGCVVSTGGGMVLAGENRQLMQQRGMVVFLDAPAQTLAERLSRNPINNQRPSLTGKGLIEEIGQILDERRRLYEEAAHHSVDASRPMAAVCREIVELWKSRNHSNQNPSGRNPPNRNPSGHA